MGQHARLAVVLLARSVVQKISPTYGAADLLKLVMSLSTMHKAFLNWFFSENFKEMKLKKNKPIVSL